MKKLIRKGGIAAGIVALSTLSVVMLSAFEAHVINVTAKIENALAVSTDAIDFGTVFPQEHLDQPLVVQLSQSFLDEDRVDDVEYFIRQKPKCAITSQNGTVFDPLNTATGHVSLGPVDEVLIDCGPAPRPLAIGETWGVLPSLCPYISKEDDQAPDNDGSLASFHEPFTFVNHQLVWNDTKGRLAKSELDTVDNWTIDLAVPCFGGYCAQDWEDFVHGINPQANPADYVQPIENEHKIFGCDLWVEVSGVSCNAEPVQGAVVSDTTNTVEGGGNAVAVAPIHPAWTASISGATWIWSENPISSQTNQTETFVKQFSVSGTPVSASLDIATDNTYSVEVNGSPVCSSADANNFALATQDVCNVTNLVSGTNTIEITVNNLGVGNQSGNPAGLLYKLSYTANLCIENDD